MIKSLETEVNEQYQRLPINPRNTQKSSKGIGYYISVGLVSLLPFFYSDRTYAQFTTDGNVSPEGKPLKVLSSPYLFHDDQNIERRAAERRTAEIGYSIEPRCSPKVAVFVDPNLNMTVDEVRAKEPYFFKDDEVVVGNRRDLEIEKDIDFIVEIKKSRMVLRNETLENIAEGFGNIKRPLKKQPYKEVSVYLPYILSYRDENGMMGGMNVLFGEAVGRRSELNFREGRDPNDFPEINFRPELSSIEPRYSLPTKVKWVRVILVSDYSFQPMAVKDLKDEALSSAWQDLPYFAAHGGNDLDKKIASKARIFHMKKSPGQSSSNPNEFKNVFLPNEVRKDGRGNYVLEIGLSNPLPIRIHGEIIGEGDWKEQRLKRLYWRSEALFNLSPYEDKIVQMPLTLLSEDSIPLGNIAPARLQSMIKANSRIKFEEIVLPDLLPPDGLKP